MYVQSWEWGEMRKDVVLGQSLTLLPLTGKKDGGVKMNVVPEVVSVGPCGLK